MGVQLAYASERIHGPYDSLRLYVGKLLHCKYRVHVANLGSRNSKISTGLLASLSSFHTTHFLYEGEEQGSSTQGFSPVYQFADKLNTESEVVGTPRWIGMCSWFEDMKKTSLCFSSALFDLLGKVL